MEYIDLNNNKVNIEEFLSNGKAIRISPIGYSMYPLIVPNRDYAIIEPYSGGAKKCDVALFRRPGSILVLHRIYKKNANGYYFVGDNQSEIEGPIDESHIKGIMVGVERNGHMLLCNNLFYRLTYHMWLFLLPVRNPIKQIVAKLKK